MTYIFFGIALVLASLLSFFLGSDMTKRKIERELLGVLKEHRTRYELEAEEEDKNEEDSTRR